ncbi:MAG: DNA-binding protein YbiB [Pigmentiphaga sp.]|nr:DNA-binding protein YbiB [Pigmentiphaga sp.]
MGISHYIKEIGRGKDGARPLSREQAADLMGQVLDGEVTDLEVGAFCLAMRIKGETSQEMAGFLDAVRQRLSRVPASAIRPTVVLPSYNGARRLPVLAPLLAQRLVEGGLRVVIHGVREDPGRTTTAQVLAAMGIPPLERVADVRNDVVNFLPIEMLSPALNRLLEVRRVVGLRNPAHSLVKLLNPCESRALVIGSYTHPEYLRSMTATYIEIGADALLSRGIEGESVADARRLQQTDAFIAGRPFRVQEAETGSIATLPDWPSDIAPDRIAAYIADVLAGRREQPAPITRQIGLVHCAVQAMTSGSSPGPGAAPDSAAGSRPAPCR